MESKPILRLKPELFVIATLSLLAISGVASAAEMATISTSAIGDYLTNEVMNIFKLVLGLTFVVGLGMILLGSMGHNPIMKAGGFKAVAAVIIVVMLFFVIPGVIGSIEDISMAGNSTNSSLLR